MPLEIQHPVWMVLFLLLTTVTFSLFGFIIGIWANNFEKLQLIPLLIVTPLTFLGGSFYSIDMLPPFWQHDHACSTRCSIWSAASAGASTASPTSTSRVSLGMTLVFLALCLTAVWWIFKTGWRLKA